VAQTSAPPSAPTASSPQRESVHDAFHRQQELFAGAKSLEFPFPGVQPERKGEMTAVWNGQTLPRKLTYYSAVPGFKDGYYTDDGFRVDQPVVASPFNANSANQIQWRQDNPNEAKYAVKINQQTGKWEPVYTTDASGKSSLMTMYNAPREFLGEVTDIATGNKYSSLVPGSPQVAPGSSRAAQPMTQGVSVTPGQRNPVPMATDVPPTMTGLSAAANAEDDYSNVPSARPPAATQPPMTVAQAAQAGIGKSPKSVGAFDSPEVNQSTARKIFSGATSDAEWKRMSGDPVNQKRVKDELLKLHPDARVLDDKEKDRVSVISQIANEFIPAYERMIALSSKEMNPQLQYINGYIDNSKFRNPDFKAAVDDVNSKISVLARGIGGEVRGVTDKDAQRVMGYGPQPEYTIKLNKELLGRFKNTLKTELRTGIPGIPKEQWKEIIKAYGANRFAEIADEDYGKETGVKYVPGAPPNIFRGQAGAQTSGQSTPAVPKL
jgi:hypothetical protein